ncbi:MAG: Formyl-CoA transferase [Actinomycetia bacterium]|nr:Formyl-CoA transferase [Actinomycetes bacterium]
MRGVRVLEVAHWVFAPAATAILADWGADVVKVEHPLHGDPQRGLVTLGIGSAEAGFNHMFDQENRGKRSIGVDLSSSSGRELLYRLVEQSDVFVTNFLPSARAKLGLEVDDVRAHNADIVYVRAHGQGQRGPERDRGGFDTATFWSRGGIAAKMTTPGAVPVAQRPGFGDHVSALALAGAVAAALFSRANGGPPSTVDVSLLSCALWAIAPDVVVAGAVPGGFPYTPREAQMNPLTNAYRTADGRWLKLHLLQSDRYWPELCRYIDRPDLAQDSRFSSAQKRAENLTAIMAELDATFASKTLEEWSSTLATMVGVWAPVQTPSELYDDVQVSANGYIQAVDYGDRSHHLVASPAQFDEEPVELRRAPDVGEQTDEVLLELGLTWDEILELKIAQVVT